MVSFIILFSNGFACYLFFDVHMENRSTKIYYLVKQEIASAILFLKMICLKDLSLSISSLTLLSCILSGLL